MRWPWPCLLWICNAVMWLPTQTHVDTKIRVQCLFHCQVYSLSNLSELMKRFCDRSKENKWDFTHLRYFDLYQSFLGVKYYFPHACSFKNHSRDNALNFHENRDFCIYFGNGIRCMNLTLMKGIVGIYTRLISKQYCDFQCLKKITFKRKISQPLVRT